MGDAIGHARERHVVELIVPVLAPALRRGGDGVGDGFEPCAPFETQRPAILDRDLGDGAEHAERHARRIEQRRVFGRAAPHEFAAPVTSASPVTDSASDPNVAPVPCVAVEIAPARLCLLMSGSAFIACDALQRLAQREEPDARLNDRRQRRVVMREKRVQPVERNDGAFRRHERGKAVPRAHGPDRAGRIAHDGDQFLDAGRNLDGIGNARLKP